MYTITNVTDTNEITKTSRQKQKQYFNITQKHTNDITFRSYDRSPRMRRASWISLGMMVIRLA